jgi:hypothetical protein
MRPLAQCSCMSAPHLLPLPGTLLYINLDTLSEAMEDFNIPSAERVALLEHLQEAIGGAPPHFWAACQVCDLKALEELVECARKYPGMVRVFTEQTYTMAHYCK